MTACINTGAARYSEGSLFRRFVNPKVRYCEHANFLYLLFRRFVNPKVRYSEHANFLYLEVR